VLKFVETPIPGVIVVEPQVHRDDRGFFLETYHEPKYREGGIRESFVQDNHARSTRGVLRGLHGQFPNPQGKLVRVVEGEVFDVAVDVRRGSPAFGQYYGTALSQENFRQMYIPPGVIHGYVVISEVSQFEYKCTDLYQPENEFSVAWNDPTFGIEWPIAEPILSAKDQVAPLLRDCDDKLADF
jgi:dTDP-4-dehydrorhamnose 3,5-epimerase